MLDWGVTPPSGPELQAQIFARPMQRNLEGDGIPVIGVRYHSQDLAEWGIRHRAHAVNVRWCAHDIGATWVKAPSVFERSSGVRAEEWVASEKQIRMSLRVEHEIPRKILRRATVEIEEINAQTRIRQRLVTVSWEPEVIDRVEKSLFMSFRVSDREEAPETTMPDDGLGRSSTPSEAPTPPQVFDPTV